MYIMLNVTFVFKYIDTITNCTERINKINSSKHGLSVLLSGVRLGVHGKILIDSRKDSPDKLSSDKRS